MQLPLEFVSLHRSIPQLAGLLAETACLCLQIPSDKQVQGLSDELKARAKLPAHVKGVLAALPQGTHPMVQFTTGIASLQVSRQHAAWSLYGFLNVHTMAQGLVPASCTPFIAKICCIGIKPFQAASYVQLDFCLICQWLDAVVCNLYTQQTASAAHTS